MYLVNFMLQVVKYKDHMILLGPKIIKQCKQLDRIAYVVTYMTCHDINVHGIRHKFSMSWHPYTQVHTYKYNDLF